MSNLSISDLFKTAWERFRIHWLWGLLLLLISIVLSLIPYLGSLANLLIQAVFVCYGLKAWRSVERFSFEEIFPKDFLTYLKVAAGAIIVAFPALLIVTVLSGFSVIGAFDTGGFYSLTTNLYLSLGLGMLAGVAMTFLFFAYPYLIVDKDLGVITALQQALTLSLNQGGTVLGFLLLALFINFLGGLVCGIGLLITTPVTLIAGAGLYVGLTDNSASQAS
ncbi:MAG: hypothetical protein N3E49_05570 [Bacteroidia bacterium]|nr:hypothetical protein [Bacteroidia bacterium]